MNKVFTYILFYIFIIGLSIGNTSQNKTLTWSFDFKDENISSVLYQVSQSTGIQISINVSIDDIYLTKKFESLTAHKILSDIFRKLNCAVIWNYSKKKLTSVDVWVFDRIKEVEKINKNKLTPSFVDFFKKKHNDFDKEDEKNRQSVFQKFSNQQKSALDETPAAAFFNNVKFKHYDPPPMPPAFFYKDIKRLEVIKNKSKAQTENIANPNKTSISLSSQNNSSNQEESNIPSDFSENKENFDNNQKKINKSIEKPPPVPPGFNQQ
jgi:hypothetical protein